MKSLQFVFVADITYFKDSYNLFSRDPARKTIVVSLNQSVKLSVSVCLSTFLIFFVSSLCMPKQRNSVCRKTDKIKVVQRTIGGGVKFSFLSNRFSDPS